MRQDLAPGFWKHALQKMLTFRSSETLSSTFFQKYFLRKSSLVQLGIIFPLKHILFLILGQYLILPIASYGQVINVCKQCQGGNGGFWTSCFPYPVLLLPALSFFEYLPFVKFLLQNITAAKCWILNFFCAPATLASLLPTRSSWMYCPCFTLAKAMSCPVTLHKIANWDFWFTMAAAWKASLRND